MLQTNYKNDINITDNLFPEAEKHLYEFYKVIKEAEESGLTSNEKTESIDKEFDACMSDDFNTALALSNLFGYFKLVKQELKKGDAKAIADINQIKETYSLLGLFKKDAKAFVKYYEDKQPKEDVPQEIKAIADERWVARTEKNWAKSDELRDKLASLGYLVKDSKEGYTLTKKD